MPLLMTDFDEVLKDAYGNIAEQLNNEVPLLNILSENERSWSGRRQVYPAHTARNQRGVGSRPEAGNLPVAGAQSHELVIVTASYFYSRIRLSGPVIKAGKHAFSDAISNEMEGVMRDAKNDISRQCFGDGLGRMAQIGCATTASTLFVFNRFFEPGQPGARYILESARIDLGTVASPSGQGVNLVVTRVAQSSNPAITVDTVTINTSYTDASQCETFVFNNGAGGCGVESLGLLAIVDQFTEGNIWFSNAYFGSAILGIARQTVGAWNANILGNSLTNRVIDTLLLQTAFDRINEESGELPDLLMGHHSVVRAVLDSAAADRRYVTSAGAPRYDAGYSSLSYNGVEIKVDRHAPYNTLLVAKRSTLKKSILSPFQWEDRDGALFSRVADQDNWDAFLSMYWNISVDGPMKSLAFIRDIRTDF